MGNADCLPHEKLAVTVTPPVNSKVMMKKIMAGVKGAKTELRSVQALAICLDDVL